MKRHAMRNDDDDFYEVEISFAGLCSFLNLSRRNPTMPDPSVILVRTDDAPEERHIPYIAFDSDSVSVDEGGSFDPVAHANGDLTAEGGALAFPFIG